MTEPEKRVLIVGAGFGGIAAALAFPRHSQGYKVTLVSSRPHFEYHPALYRVVTGRSPLEVCIPIVEVLKERDVEFIADTIESIDAKENLGQGRSGSRYAFDYLVLALGSQTAYFGIPGLEKFSFGFKSITEALRLKRHLHELFSAASTNGESPEETTRLLHFVVVGAGASGVELAGELAAYAKTLAREHGVEENLVTIELIEAAERILPALPEYFSERVEKRLRSLGVNIFTNRAMLKERLEEINVRGMTMKTETVVWTAGVTPNTLYARIQGLALDERGRVVVDEYLRAGGFENVFVVGDGAATPYTGMAQTAVNQGKLTARNIIRALAGEALERYAPKKPSYVIPVGPGWAAALVDGIALYGSPGWFIRRLADLLYFLSILPAGKALSAFKNGKTLCETCAVCTPNNIKD